MENTGQAQEYSVEQYLRGIVPNAQLSEDAVSGILIDACIEPKTPAKDLTERQHDLALAYLYIRIASNPLTSQRVTDKDGDWEHSEGSEQWSRSQLQQFLILARNLLAKWGVDDPILDSLLPKWGFRGTGFRYIRK